MAHEGMLVKMPVTRRDDGAVDYMLRLEQLRPGAGEEPSAVEHVALDDLVGRAVRLRHTGRYACTRCGRGVDKLFGEGFCYPCFRDAPENSECIVRPELCEAHLGGGRDPEWEERHHNQPHVVYLAVTSAVKVGVTRSVQVPTRWIDQGAAWAFVIARVPYRRLAGEIEVALKARYTDRTVWQHMLKGIEAPPVDPGAELAAARAHLEAHAPDLAQWVVAGGDLERVDLHYPLPEAPAKVKSANLQKTPHIESRLVGVRGQYLVFDGGLVMNVRRHSGFFVEIDVLD